MQNKELLKHVQCVLPYSWICFPGRYIPSLSLVVNRWARLKPFLQAVKNTMDASLGEFGWKSQELRGIFIVRFETKFISHRIKNICGLYANRQKLLP